ncbi:antitoxin [Pseudomonas sp. NPDC088368]|uniref:antitoxin n=1 Tax=Pseudomonas sp. NPDC088368 TaxID=3364453 RepID=UPI0038129E70
MSQTAKVFVTGRSQAVRLPASFRFDTDEVFIRRDPSTGDVILSRKPDSWSDFFSLLSDVHVPEDFLSDAERHRSLGAERDPLDGIDE